MCDDRTEEDNQAYLLNRRQVGGGAVAVLLTGCAAKQTPADASAAASSSTGELKSRTVSITTPDGTADAFFMTPSEGAHPAVIMWPDIAGLRPAFETMATRLAKSGYAVLAVNQYYRTAQAPILKAFAEWRTDEGRAKISPAKELLNPDTVASDGAAFVQWLDQQPEVDTGKKIATTGYCMGGPFTVYTAAAAPERIGVIGSFHGGGLVKDDANSPHKLFSKMKAAALICIAQNGDQRQPEAKDALKEAATAAELPAEIEVYPANHGWCAIDSPVYDTEQADRAWGRMLAMFDAHL